MRLPEHRELAEAAVRLLAERGGRQPGVGNRYEELVHTYTGRGNNLLDAWENLVSEARKAAARRSYSPFDLDRSAGKPLLKTALGEDRPEEGTDEAKFVAPTSMRDVEPSVHLWLERRRLGGRS
jgi:hypothetical protein